MGGILIQAQAKHTKRTASPVIEWMPPILERVMNMDPENQVNQQIQQLFQEFFCRVPVWSLTTFTVDGYVIAHRTTTEKISPDIEFVISSMSTGLITIAEDFIVFVDNLKKFKQILIDATSLDATDQFSIILLHVAQNVLLACIFPQTTQLGLLSYELDNLQKRIREIVSNLDLKLHKETMT